MITKELLQAVVVALSLSFMAWCAASAIAKTHNQNIEWWGP